MKYEIPAKIRRILKSMKSNLSITNKFVELQIAYDTCTQQVTQINFTVKEDFGLVKIFWAPCKSLAIAKPYTIVSALKTNSDTEAIHFI